MPPPTDREEILARLRKSVADGKAIVGAGAGRSYFLLSEKYVSSFVLVQFQIRCFLSFHFFSYAIQ
jgi:hypothetical protein